VLTIAGCAIGPTTPARVVERRYRDQTTPAEAASLADLPWWDVYQDETLRGLIGEALANNYDLRVAAMRVEEARARAGIARSEFFPQINGEFDATRGVNSVLGAPSPGAPRDDAFLLAAGMAWEIDIWGRSGTNEVARAASTPPRLRRGSPADQRRRGCWAGLSCLRARDRALSMCSRRCATCSSASTRAASSKLACCARRRPRESADDPGLSASSRSRTGLVLLGREPV
jgi:hypothetical protein